MISSKPIKTITVHLLLLTTAFLTGCGDGGTGSPQGSPLLSNASAADIANILKQLDVTILTYNGYNADKKTYDSNASLLAGDLSATAPENLYLTVLYKNALDRPNPGKHDIKLPASNKILAKTETVLNPALSMVKPTSHHLIEKYAEKLKPNKDNPVILTVPTGLETNIETPFFPERTRYTAVIPEVSPAQKETAIFSFQSGQSIRIGLFAHPRNKKLNLRVYDNKSTVDVSKPAALLLSEIAVSEDNYADLYARYLSLTSDDMNLKNFVIGSLRDEALRDMGWNSEILGMTRDLFPELVKVTYDPSEASRYNVSYTFKTASFDPGIFCLGGKNTFPFIDTSNKTFVFPVSGADKKTTITKLYVSADSGFIITPKKHLHVIDLYGIKLNIIANLPDTSPVATDAPVVQIDNLKKATKTIVVKLGPVNPAFPLPAGGFKLLSYKNAPSVPEITFEDIHLNGTYVGGTAEWQGKTLSLTTLTPRPAALGNGAVGQLMAQHPAAQGVPVAAFQQLLNRLTPMPALSSINQNFAATSLNKLLTQNMTHQDYAQQLNQIHFDGSYGVHHTTNAAIRYATTMNNTILQSQAYASTQQGSDHHEMGLSISAFSPVHLDATTTLTPAVSLGYAMNRFDTLHDSVGSIHITFNDVVSHSTFIQALAAVDYQIDAAKFSIGAGVEGRYGMFSNGAVASEGLSFSMANDNLCTISSMIQANFQTSTFKAGVTLWNFKTVQFNVEVNQ